MIHNSNFKDSLRFVYEEMKQRDPEFHFVIVSKKELFHSSGSNFCSRIIGKMKGIFYFYVMLNYHFATAEYIFLNDNFLPLAYMPLKKETKLLQFWHGVGAFKKFGLSTEQNPLVRKLVWKGNQQVDYMFVSSTEVIPFYKEAMGIPEKHIYPTGIPLTDYYFQEDKKQKAFQKIYNCYAQVKSKKLILYAPTFRKTEEENDAILKHFDCTRIIKELGQEYTILVRMHPQIRPEARRIEAPCIDVTDYPDVKELYMVSDILITDYSSVVVEYALLNKPIILYSYDLEQYDRGFYGSYEEMVPGVIARDNMELIAAIKESAHQNNTEKREQFLAHQYDYLDGKSTNRVVDFICQQQ